MSITIEMEDHVCCSCGIAFTIPERIGRQKREKGGEFFCPNGHSLSYTKSEVQKLKEQLDAKEKEAQTLRLDLYKTRDDKDKAQRKLSRLENGVCHKCNRTFLNLQRHMTTKHSHGKAKPV